VLLLTVLGLSFIGTLLVWSATRGAGSHTFVVKQLLNIVIGLTLMTIVSVLDYRHLRMYAPVLYAVSLLGLLAVLTPLGTPVNGSKSWITLPAGFQIEPSEFGKIAIILMSAMFLSEARNAQGRPGLRAVALTLACAVVPIALVEREPDLGVVIIMLVLLGGLIALSGLRLRWVAALAAAGTLTVLAVLKLHLLHAYQLHRLTSFLNPTADPTGAGYNAAQAKIAVGSGGLTGQGLFHGQLIAGNFVPEQHTDFIFAVAGEELGFAGGAVIICLLAILLLRALRIAATADNQFGMLVASGIAIWFAVQSFINIGMTIGIMPVTGLPLPFVSYGGSAMFADMVAIGALQAVHRHRTVFG
jgi:rod shape determining protein RodA